MLTISSGHDVKYLTDAVGAGREGYYTGAVAAGEPPGVWYGAGAELLGLTGEVDAQQMEGVYAHLLDPRDPAAGSRMTWGQAPTLGKPHKQFKTADQIYQAALEREPDAGPERREKLRGQAERSARQAVSFVDMTFSVPKSVSVLGVAFERKANDARAAGDHEEAEAWDAHVKAVEEAVMAGAQATIDYLQDKAGYARVGHHGGGAGRWIRAEKFTVAQFLQHDSRDRDPQLHVHQAILNRIFCADGVWRALDTTLLRTWKAAADAIGLRVMEAHLAASLGARADTRPDGLARELVGVDAKLRDLFSSRTRAIGPKAAKLIAAYVERFRHDPSPLVRNRLAKQATMTTRRPKEHGGETEAQRLDRWDAECRADRDHGLAQVADDVVNRAQEPGPAARFSEQDVIDRAIAGLEAARGTWGRSEAIAHLSAALPANLDVAPHDVLPLLEGLADRLLERAQRLSAVEPTSDLPADYRHPDGTSVFERPGATRYATTNQVAGEQALRRAAVARGAATLTAEQADATVARFAESGVPLGADQAAVLRGVLTSGARVEVLAAAAGTGKSFTVGALADAWTETGRRVIGLAPSQVAAQVLTGEGVPARNVSAWLTGQQRLDEHRPIDGDAGWQLRADDLVVVDEAAMTPTGDLVAIHQRCHAAGAKLLLVGDPRQLAAVGPGGALTDVAEHGIRYELAQVHRFANDWEGRASLALRDGDPAALNAYQRHGRLVDAGTGDEAERAAARAWLADTLDGRESLLLVGSNEAAARVAAGLRAQLVELGRVDEHGAPLGRTGWEGTVAGVGDLVQARRNGWELRGRHGNTHAPINRETYQVTAVHDDGALTVTPISGHDADGTEQPGGSLFLPASYVGADLTLGYASTVHAAQGRTVDTAHAVLGSRTDAPGAYVAMSRGRDRNTAYVITRNLPADAPTGQTHEVAPRTARAVLADVLENAEPERSALAEAEHSTQQARSTMTHADKLITVAADATAGRTAAALDRLTADGTLSELDRKRLAADDGIAAVERPLRLAELAGLDRDELLTRAVAARNFDGARSAAQVLYARLDDQLAGHRTPTLGGYADLIPTGLPDEHHQFLHNRAATADERRRELGAETAAACPQWAREALGPVPEDPDARAAWEHAAGWAASWRELADHDDPAEPLGAAPPAGLVEKRALWRTAHAHLGLPDGGGDEHECSDGQLRTRVRAMDREEAWAPRWIGDELDATEHAARQASADAQVFTAHADRHDDPAEAVRLRDAAADAEQHAAALTERAEQLHQADLARAEWYAATAATRDTAARARGALAERGIDPDNPVEQTTADQWLDTQRADQADDDADREITDEAQLYDPQREADRAALDDAAPVAGPEVLDTGLPDVRDTSRPDRTEHTEPARRRQVPSTQETAEAVARAQTALAELAARRESDTARHAEEQVDAARRDHLNRWAGDDHAAEQPGGRYADEPMELDR